MPYQEAAGDPRATPEILGDAHRALYVVEVDGTVHRGARAALFANSQCGWWLLPAVFWYPPMKWCADLGYWVLANNRIFFSRFVYTKGKGQPPAGG